MVSNIEGSRVFDREETDLSELLCKSLFEIDFSKKSESRLDRFGYADNINSNGNFSHFTGNNEISALDVIRR